MLQQTKQQLNRLYTVLYDYECIVPDVVIIQLLQQSGINLYTNHHNNMQNKFMIKLISSALQLYLHKLLLQCQSYSRIRFKEKPRARQKPYLLIYDDLCNVLNDMNIYLQRNQYIAENLLPIQQDTQNKTQSNTTNNNAASADTTSTARVDDKSTTATAKRKRPTAPSRNRRKQAKTGNDE